ncbi:MAG: divalent-cation tolerance protein CutA [Longimicrobiaceae bacterium]
MADTGVSVVLVSVPDAGVGRRLARALLDERLVACANLVPGVTSLYRWEGEVQEEDEVLLVMKTSSGLVPRLTARIPELHPYELPEVLALRVTDGLPAYCRWVLDETGGG